MAIDQGTPRRRAQRVDARRNRERLLHAARAVFAADGAHASLQGIAREAGVGIGTLYRHFPSRETLYTAVYEQEVDHLVAMAAELAERHEPIAALRAWLHALVALVATKTGMASALAITAETKSAVSQATSERLVTAIGALLARGRDTHSIRQTLAPRELLHAVVGMCLIQDSPDWQDRVAALIDILIDGLQMPASS
ncbi:helix-turn-helix domain-containing protein [Salinisphaera sp. T31B1]|uniref:TetR/AcrR family transcriptional regulator n=1 Tax=Salinisphaera sp. T31B1 TaxID=727963 RepID=UPI003342BB57